MTDKTLPSSSPEERSEKKRAKEETRQDGIEYLVLCLFRNHIFGPLVLNQGVYYIHFPADAGKRESSFVE